MAPITVRAERRIAAPAEDVYRYVADAREHRPRYLPPAITDFEVEEGGVGAGTVLRFTLQAGGRSRPYRMAVTEPEPGRVLVESDTASSLVTTTTVTPDTDGSLVAIVTTWEGAGGVGGFFERLFAPRTLQRVYDEELQHLDAYARGRTGA